MKSPFKRRRSGLIASGAAAAALLGSMAFAGTAGATTTTPGNSTLIGSGSSTTYYLMQQMDVLFNDSQGCQIFDPTSANQLLNLACESTVNSTAGTNFTPPEQLAVGFGENPYNDISVQEPYIGSSNGIAQLKYQGSNNPSNGYLPAPISYARSSRALKGSDPKGMNFVAYAEDGLDWITFSAVSNTNITPPSSCLNTVNDSSTGQSNDIEKNFLQEIWDTNGTDISDWAQLCALIQNPTSPNYSAFEQYNAPICVYTSQDGSGTLSTWDGYLGGSATENQISSLTPNSTALTWAQSQGFPNNGAFVNAGCTNGSNGSAYGATHQIFENETQQIVAQGKTQTGASNQYSDTADSIFFYSYGRYSKQCKPGNAICEPTGFTVNLGKIQGQLPNQQDITCGDNGGCTNPWAVHRYIYNVYGNGDTSQGIPAATPATINYVSEIGFICKPQTYSVTVQVGRTTETEQKNIVDPGTGKAYLTEIQTIIKGQGFFPVPLQSTEDSGTISNPAISLIPAWGSTGDAYGIFDPYYNSSYSTNIATNNQDNYNYNTTGSSDGTGTSPAGADPKGYCLVTTTG